jgi:hypothetical protein
MIKNPDSELKQKVSSHLELNCIGREHTITGEHLTELLGIKDRRILRRIIHGLRLEQNSILSTCENPHAGYFIPADESEIGEAMQHFKSRVINQNRACAGIRQGLEKRFPGCQIKLDLDLGA